MSGEQTRLARLTADFDAAERELLAELPWWAWRRRRRVRANAARQRAVYRRADQAEQRRIAAKPPKALRGVAGAKRRPR